MEHIIVKGRHPDGAAIRQRVFVEEQGFQGEFDEIDAQAFHVVLYEDGNPIATGRVFWDEKGMCIIGRVAVDKACRGKKAGTHLLKLLEEKAREEGAQKISLCAQEQARGFYEKNGYHAIGAGCYEEGCPHVTMEKAL